MSRISFSSENGPDLPRPLTHRSAQSAYVEPNDQLNTTGDFVEQSEFNLTLGHPGKKESS